MLAVRYPVPMPIQRILSIDDNSTDQFVHRRRIQKHDPSLEVVDAEHGQQALDILAAGKFWPDLILLDVNMPVMGGFEFLDGAVAAYTDTIPPVVLTLTSSFQDQDMDRAVEYSAVVGWLVKPLTQDWFGQVQAMLARARGT